MPEHDDPIPDARPAPGEIPAAEPVSPLNEAHYRLIHEAVRMRRPIDRAVGVAKFSAYTILGVGLLSLPIALLAGGWEGPLMALVICVIGILEYSGMQKLRQGEVTAAGQLGWNQAAFMALIIIYCLNRLVTLESEAISPEMRQQLDLLGTTGDLEGLISSLGYLLYGTVILLTIGFQGGLSLYYFSRRKYLLALKHQMPEWILRLMREMEG